MDIDMRMLSIVAVSPSRLCCTPAGHHYASSSSREGSSWLCVECVAAFFAFKKMNKNYI
jgi:hypothetical protein